MGTVLKLQYQLRKIYKQKETYSFPEPQFELASLVSFYLTLYSVRKTFSGLGKELLEAQLCFGCLAWGGSLSLSGPQLPPLSVVDDNITFFLLPRAIVAVRQGNRCESALQTQGVVLWTWWTRPDSCFSLSLELEPTVRTDAFDSLQLQPGYCFIVMKTGNCLCGFPPIVLI